MSGSSASLPSDYGLLSHYTGPPSIHSEDDARSLFSTDSLSDRSDNPRSRSRSSGLGRRRIVSAGLGHHLSRVSTIDSESEPLPDVQEDTPLLGDYLPQPRIVEDADENSLATYWTELKILCWFLVPVWFSNLFSYSLVLASVVSIGHLSTTALAASTLATMTASVTGYSIIQGLASALDTFLPSAWMSPHPELVGLWTQRMALITAITLIPIACIWSSAESILLLLRQDPEVARLAALYLRWALLGLPAYSFNQLVRRYLFAQGLANVPARIVVFVAPVNAILNYLLVWGPESIRLGFIGAPIATAISFNLIALLSLAYCLVWVPSKAWTPLSRRIFSNLGVVMRLGIFGVVELSSTWWAWELVGLAASQIGPIALASHSIILVSGSTAFQAPYSSSVAASVRVGNLLGEKKAFRANLAFKAAFILALIIGGINCLIFTIFHKSWARLFTDDPEVISLVSSILPLCGLYQFVESVGVCSAGVLRAQGRQGLGAILNLTAYYVIGIPLGLWLTFSTGMELYGLWIGLTAALTYHSVVGFWVCMRSDWDYEVEKIQKRLQKEKEIDERLKSMTAGDV